MTEVPIEQPITVGAIIYPDMDQMDFTGPFEVLARLPNSRFHVLWKNKNPLRDKRGLILTADTSFAESPSLDVLVIPGGYGQQQLMEDEETLAFISKQAAAAICVLTVCTGALIAGAAGLLRGRRATTHWTAHDLLPYFGAIPVKERYVVDGHFISAAGVTAGLDAALKVAALLRGERAAQEIQLYAQYDPAPPFDCGSPERAHPNVLRSVLAGAEPMQAARLETARQFAKKFQEADHESYPCQS